MLRFSHTPTHATETPHACHHARRYARFSCSTHSILPPASTGQPTTRSNRYAAPTASRRCSSAITAPYVKAVIDKIVRDATRARAARRRQHRDHRATIRPDIRRFVRQHEGRRASGTLHVSVRHRRRRRTSRRGYGARLHAGFLRLRLATSSSPIAGASTRLGPLALIRPRHARELLLTRCSAVARTRQARTRRSRQPSVAPPRSKWRREP